MQFLNVKLKKIDCAAYRKNHATEADCSTLITEDTTVLVDDKPIIVYLANLQHRTDELFNALTKIKYETSTRTNGLVTSSKIFGYAPKNEIRNLSCRAASIAFQQPQESAVLKKFASIASAEYHKTNEQLAKKHIEMTDNNVKPNYRMNDSMFTSGIVNHNNPLKYHFDSGNYIGVWSAMFALKKDVGGGHLACPEIDIAFECRNGSLTMFDGQSILHGVTPIVKKTPEAVRFTVVYYSLKKMWSCESPEQEIELMRNKRTNIEKGRRKK
jgi:hypothetical protein